MKTKALSPELLLKMDAYWRPADCTRISYYFIPSGDFFPANYAITSHRTFPESTNIGGRMNCPGTHIGNGLHFAFTARAATTARIILGSIVMTLILALQATAGGMGELQKYFSEAGVKVKATDNPAEKREILDQSFQTMSAAIEMAKKSELISKNDGVGLDRFRAALQEKQDELAGNNGYVRVPDEQLNAFSDYVVQDSEQADQVITISVITLLLILLLVVLIVR